MGEAVGWSFLRTAIPIVDMAMYLDMPEDIARTVEIRDGMVVHCESPSPNHAAISDNTKAALRGDAVAVDVVDPLDVTVGWNQLELGPD